ncbi:MAG: glutamine amidotransferase [Pseudomonadota bacterium]
MNSAPPAAHGTGGPRGKPVLIVLHQATSTPGRVGQVLRSRGFRLDIRRPALGDNLPATTRNHAGVVIFGGPQSANDPDAFIKREIDFIDVPLRESTPFLGICLGAQMLAKAVGGHVAPHHGGQVEIGYYDLHPTRDGKALMEWPGKVYQWHREGFHTPKGTPLLATGQDYEQAFRIGENAYGIQFHPEITLAMLYRWTTRGHERMALPGARKRADHFKGRALYDGAVKSWLGRFLSLWLPQELAGQAAHADQRAADAREVQSA